MIAGLKADNSPYLMSSDIIGAQCFKDDFVVAGDTAETLFGMCESVYRWVRMQVCKTTLRGAARGRVAA